MGDYRKMVVVNDHHIRSIDMKLHRLVLGFLRAFQPDDVVFAGDFLDCYSISPFDKHPKNGFRLQEEFDMGWDILGQYRDACPDADFYYLEGNHEFWLKKILLKNPQLAGLRDLTIPAQLHFDELEVEWVATPDDASKWMDVYKKFGKLYVGHFDRVSKHSAYTAKAVVDDKGVSIVQGHTHRGGVYYKTLLDGSQLVGIENFCMCDLNPAYMNNPNWQQGFTVVYYKAKGSGRFHAYPTPIVGHKFFFGGQEFS